MTTQQSEAYDGVIAVYPPHTEDRHKYSGEALLTFIEYIMSIVLVGRLKRMLSLDFLHIDGALIFQDGRPAVQDLTVVRGRREFIEFFRRQVVGRQIVPNGPLEAVMIPVPASELLHTLVAKKLQEQGVQIEGELVAAGVVYFPNRLRLGGDPLVLPPHLRRVGEEFPALAATGDIYNDSHVIRVIQMVYRQRTIFGRQINCRVGLVLDHPRSVPEAIYDEIVRRRRGDEVNYPSAQDFVRQLVDWAAHA
jgi:hypothetical protein